MRRIRRTELGRRIQLVRRSDTNRTRCLHSRHGTSLAAAGPQTSNVGVPGSRYPDAWHRLIYHRLDCHRGHADIGVTTNHVWAGSGYGRSRGRPGGRERPRPRISPKVISERIGHAKYDTTTPRLPSSVCTVVKVKPCFSHALICSASASMVSQACSYRWADSAAPRRSPPPTTHQSADAHHRHGPARTREPGPHDGAPSWGPCPTAGPPPATPNPEATAAGSL